MYYPNILLNISNILKVLHFICVQTILQKYRQKRGRTKDGCYSDFA